MSDNIGLFTGENMGGGHAILHTDVKNLTTPLSIIEGQIKTEIPLTGGNDDWINMRFDQVDYQEKMVVAHGKDVFEATVRAVTYKDNPLIREIFRKMQNRRHVIICINNNNDKVVLGDVGNGCQFSWSVDHGNDSKANSLAIQFVCRSINPFPFYNIEGFNYDQYIEDNPGSTWEDFMGYIKGDPGKSAYQIWLDEGNVGTEQDFLDYLAFTYAGTDGTVPVYDSTLGKLKDSVLKQVAGVLKVGSFLVGLIDDTVISLTKVWSSQKTDDEFAVVYEEMGDMQDELDNFTWAQLNERPFDLWTVQQYDASPEALANFDNWLDGKYPQSVVYENNLWDYFISTDIGIFHMTQWGDANAHGIEGEELEDLYKASAEGDKDFTDWKEGTLVDSGGGAMAEPGTAEYQSSDAYHTDIAAWKATDPFVYADYKATAKWTADYSAWLATANLGKEEWLEAIVNDVDKIQMPATVTTTDWYTVAKTSIPSTARAVFEYVSTSLFHENRSIEVGVSFNSHHYIHNTANVSHFNQQVDLMGIRILIPSTPLGGPAYLQFKFSHTDIGTACLKLRDRTNNNGQYWELTNPFIQNSITDYSVGSELTVGAGSDTQQTSEHYVLNNKRVLHTDDLATINSSIATKEPAIGPKNTAFNKNFGTLAGMVSEGNHSHSWTQITGKPKIFTVGEIVNNEINLSTGDIFETSIESNTTFIFKNMVAMNGTLIVKIVAAGVTQISFSGLNVSWISPVDSYPSDSYVKFHLTCTGAGSEVFATRVGVY